MTGLPKRFLLGGFTLIIRAATPEDAPAIARVHVDSRRSTYPGLMPEAYLASLSYERSEAFWTRILTSGGLVFVAVDDDSRVFGFASGGPQRDAKFPYSGELYAIYLLAGDQGRGAGRKLVQALMGALRAAGHTDMLVWVLAANPSRGFYEHLGGKPVGAQQVEMGGVAVEEVAYGWDSI
jgi:GNAT superfamily N-acetyltransferase